MPAQEMQFQAGPFKTRGWLWKKEGSEKGVLVLHEAYGVDDNVLSACDKLHSLGYNVFAFDIFGKEGPHPQAFGSERWTLERLLKPAYSDENMHKRIESAIGVLRQNNATKLAIAGFGILGGTFASLYPCKHNGKTAAAVSVCGPIVREPGEWKFQPLSEVRSADCPIFFAFAEEDPWIPKRDIPLLEQNIAEAKKQCKVKTYAGTKSGFSSGFYNPKSPHYSKKLAEECWGDATAFLEQHLK